jgi:hypothetical protein
MTFHPIPRQKIMWATISISEVQQGAQYIRIYLRISHYHAAKPPRRQAAKLLFVTIIDAHIENG